MNKIQESLNRFFSKHRIVFWYDAKKELRSDFEDLEIPNVEKIELNNNEFNVKHRILREQPNNKFLIYYEGSQPGDLDNWLLDVLLANGEFRTDQAAIHLNELGLGIEFVDLTNDHLPFFKAAKRRTDLKKKLTKEDSHGVIRMKMLSVCAGAEPRLDTILENLLDELAEGKTEKIDLIKNCNLDSFLWEQLKRHFSYESTSSGLQDFTIELFKSCYDMELGGTPTLKTDALVFLKRWKDSIRHSDAYIKLSEECADILSIENDLQKRDIDSLVDVDFFQIIDKKIISDLVKKVADRTLSAGECASIVKTRRQSHWFQNFSHLYDAIDFGALFLYELDSVNFQISDLADGITKYAQTWSYLDYLYRKYVYHSRQSGQTSLLEKLTASVEDLYTNNFLLKMNDIWQQQVDQCVKWQAAPVIKQDKFFDRAVKPKLKNQKKIYVIISDAFRYEVANELLSLIIREDRYEGELKPMLGMLPSYTQLGMAALLPNNEITFAGNGASTVLVDDASTQGTANRAKILAQNIDDGATAIRAEDLLGMNKDESRDLLRENSVVYIYHNRIDATGDKKDSEDRVFEATEEALQELVKVIKKLTAANATNLIVTSDHGFIYQNKPIGESDFSGAEVGGQQIIHRDRRFILGKGLHEHSSLKKFTAKELGLSGDMEIQIPKSINRLRLKGSGSRYVHGGASLQEVVIPLLSISKKRKSDVSNVEVDIIKSGSSTITSGQLSVAFYQTSPVTGKNHPRTLQAGIYSQSGELLSDSHELVFDFVSESPRDRELKIRFLLTRKADDFNGQEVILRLVEPISGTSKFKEYKTVRYTLQRSFTSDFDF